MKRVEFIGQKTHAQEKKYSPGQEKLRAVVYVCVRELKTTNSAITTSAKVGDS